ncbi:hypothetical protein [Halostella pelagica]|uniref:hypothetical protein n=1 Tax=Halostella pelagica TaxID=2583824 RepID=UPI0010821C32|nr:hypothetical protein [Halostella pelagica]
MLEKLVHAVVGYRSRRDDESFANHANAAAATAVGRVAPAARRALGLADAALAAALVAALLVGAAATAFAVAVAVAVLPDYPAGLAVVLALGGANVFVGLPLLAVRAAEVVGDQSLDR